MRGKWTTKMKAGANCAKGRWGMPNTDWGGMGGAKKKKKRVL